MNALLIDFGSTYTKVTLVSLDPPGIIGVSRAPTTVKTSLLEGLERALAGLPRHELARVGVKRACSSAAGGLRVVAIGLVPELTVKAAREAALGAGARVVAAYSYVLTPEDIAEIRGLKPDMVLLAGGTDGGDRKAIVENARMLAAAELGIPVVVAGNRAAAGEVVKILEGHAPRVVVTANVLPELQTLNVEPARKAIRELYLSQITKAKGLDVVQEETGLAMPTPLAVMRAGELLYRHFGEEVVVVDVGGATTDVHSFGEGLPAESGCIYKGLPEPFAKRTVEGDLGVRVSAAALLETVGFEGIACSLPFLAAEEEVIEYVRRVSEDTGALPSDQRERQYDQALAIACIREALRRHAGFLREVFTPEGRLWVQQGKDLRRAGVLVGTGGVLVYGEDAARVLGEGLRVGDPLSLVPRSPRLYLDSRYTLAAIGLLADDHEDVAVALIRETLKELGRYSA